LVSVVRGTFDYEDETTTENDETGSGNAAEDG
jgi:hypothetical protein